MSIITRFAPSPTGSLHIGSARTALFNYLFAKHHGGKFLLRIEDTDRARSTEEAVKAILNGLNWLNLNWDDEVVYQYSRSSHHAEVAKTLIASGKAYYCFMSQAEIEVERNKATSENRSFLINSPWRDAKPSEFPSDIKPVIRLKAPRTGQTIIEDLVQGKVVVENDHLDDMILLRSDGTPTYMLAVVVDDHDMGITHIIRGDDHLTNAFRQILLYQAFGWEIPRMAHIPLIHGMDGAKLSKRHGALGVDWYQQAGYLPEAICNYLLRLGWSHGDAEFIDRNQAIYWFDTEGLGRSPSRLDYSKMQHYNAHYLKQMPAEKILELIKPQLKGLSAPSEQAILKAMDSLKPRASLLTDIVELAKIYIIETDPEITPEAQKVIAQTNPELLEKIKELISKISLDSAASINEEFKKFAAANGEKIGIIMQPIRGLLTGLTASPSVFEIIAIIGREASLRRLNKRL